jgi:hypothetical protein
LGEVRLHLADNGRIPLIMPGQSRHDLPCRLKITRVMVGDNRYLAQHVGPASVFELIKMPWADNEPRPETAPGSSAQRFRAASGTSDPQDWPWPTHQPEHQDA